MEVLVIHQKLPGQFAHQVRTWCQRPGWEVRGLDHKQFDEVRFGAVQIE